MRRAIDVELQESCWVAVTGPQELPIGGRVGNAVLLGAGLLVEPRARANERCHGDERPAADKVVVAVAADISVHAISKQKNRAYQGPVRSWGRRRVAVAWPWKLPL